MRRTSQVFAVMVVAVSPLLAGVAEGRAAPSPLPTLAVPAGVSAFADGFRIEASASYQLDPPAGAVHVALDLTLTNQRPDQVVGGFIRQFYLPEFGVPVLAEAAGLRAVKSDGTVLPVSVEGTESPRFSFAVIDLRPDLYHPSTQTIRLTYDLPRQAPRSDRFTRLNDAYATFPMLAIGDPGLSNVEVLVPDGFEVELVGDPMDKSERDGQQVYTASAIEDPFAWTVQVAARDDDKLLERVVDLGDQEVRVLGWPDDPEWADFADTQVSEGVPMLEELIGIDWPADGTIDVVESSSPYLYGYAGWYRPLESIIEVGDELDEHVMLHELAHLWFNDDLFAGRWINEAFAEVFAAAALTELGVEAEGPAPIEPDHPGRILLNDWGDPNFQSGDTDAQETFGYNAAWTVLHRVAEEVGVAALAESVQVADARQLPYRADTSDAVLTRAIDWRALLDLLEEVSGSATAEAVFRELVVAEADQPLLDERAEARSGYAALEEVGAGWAPPLEVRQEMGDWDFDEAVALFPDVERLYEQRDALEREVAAIDLALPDVMQTSFEDADDVGDLADLMTQAADAGAALLAAEAAHDDGAGPLGAIGLLASGVDGDLEAARIAFASGDYEWAIEQSAKVEDALDGAAAAGLLRLAGGAALIAVWVLLVRQLRRRRARPAGPGPLVLAGAPGEGVATGAPGPDEPALQADGAEGIGGPPDDGGEVGV